MSSKRKPSQQQIVIIAALLIFVAVSLLLHLITVVITGLLDQTMSQSNQQMDESIEIYQELAESVPPPEQVTEDAAAEEPASIISTETAEPQLSFSADELPSFDCSSRWVNEDGSQAFISTSNSIGTLYLLSGSSAVSLETAVSGKILECNDCNISYALSEVVSNGAASVQTINTSMGGLYTDIFIATPDELLQFTLDRTGDSDGHIYAEIRTFVQEHFDLDLLDAPDPEPVSDAAN